MRFKNVYNDDAPKRSGGIEKGTHYFQEIVAMNEAKRVWMKLCFCEHANEACMKSVVEHDESKRQICTLRGFGAVTTNRRVALDCGDEMLPG
jgi:hypothetical protein